MASTTTSSSSATTLLDSFEYERILSEGTLRLHLNSDVLLSLIQPPVRLLLADPRSLVVYLLGTAIPASSSERTPAIIKIEKTPYDPQEVVGLTSPTAWEKLETVRRSMKRREGQESRLFPLYRS